MVASSAGGLALDPSTPLTEAHLRTSNAVLAYAALIVCVSMGIRHTFGLFLTPMSTTHGWGREGFSLAMAIQNLT